MIMIIRRLVIKRCPYKDETDAGELTIVIRGEAPELHELARQVDALTAAPVSHEDFTAAVARLLPDGATVTTTWNTGPWSVKVSETTGTEGR